MVSTGPSPLAALRGAMWGWLMFAGVAWLAVSWSVLRLEPADVVHVAGPVVLFGALTEALRAGAGTRTWWMNAGMAVLFTVTGCVLLAEQATSYTTPAALIGWYLMVRGAVDIAVAVMTRDTDRVWGLITVVGVLEVGLGFFAASPLSRTADLTVTVLGGLGLLRAVADLVTGLRLREVRVPRADVLDLPPERAAGLTGYTAGFDDFETTPAKPAARHRAPAKPATRAAGLLSRIEAPVESIARLEASTEHLPRVDAPTEHPARADAPTEHPARADAPTEHPPRADAPVKHVATADTPIEHIARADARDDAGAAQPMWPDGPPAPALGAAGGAPSTAAEPGLAAAGGMAAAGYAMGGGHVDEPGPMIVPGVTGPAHADPAHAGTAHTGTVPAGTAHAGSALGGAARAGNEPGGAVPAGAGAFHDEVLRTTADLDAMLALAGVTGAATGAGFDDYDNLPSAPDTPEGVERPEPADDQTPR